LLFLYFSQKTQDFLKLDFERKSIFQIENFVKFW